MAGNEQAQAAAAEAERRREQKELDAEQKRGKERLLATARRPLSSDRPKSKAKTPKASKAQKADRQPSWLTADSRKPSDAAERLMSLETEHWVAMRKAADAVGHQVLAKAYRRLGIAYTAGEHGVRMNAYSREHILANSDGAKSVAANLERRGVKRGRATPQDQQRANFEERNNKRMFPLAEFRGMWRARNEARGFLVFEQADKRLEAGYVHTQAMTPAQAVDAGLALAASRGERVFDERKLLEFAIKGSGFATPHADIRDEIGRQLLMQELVLHRGAVVRPAPGQELDAGQAVTPERRVAPLVSLDAAIDLLKSESALSQAERDAVLSMAAGESTRTIVPTTPSGQPAVLAVVEAAAATSGRAYLELAPLSHVGGAGEGMSVEAALEGRAPLSASPAVLVLKHANEMSGRTLEAVRARAVACDARLVELHAADRLRHPFSPHQVNERALLARAQPFEQLHREVSDGRTQATASREDTVSPAVRQAAEKFSSGERVLVLTDSQASASALNERIAASLSEVTGEAVKKVRVRKARPVDVGGAKLAASYSVGDTVLVKRTTGALRRREIATVDAINVRAGFLTLRVGDGEHARSVKMSLDTQAHHIERVEVQEVSVTPGAVLRVNESLPSLGLESGQAVQVEHVDVESKRLRARGASGSEHEVSFSSPAPLSPAMAMTPSELTDADLAHLRAATPDVVVALSPDAEPADVAAVLHAATRLDAQAQVYAPQELLDRHPPAVELAPELALVPAVAGARLVIHEHDFEGVASLRKRLMDADAMRALESTRITLVMRDGARRLFLMRNRAAMEALELELGKVIGPAPVAEKTLGKAAALEQLPTRPANQERTR
ncbi:hypothetical protein ACG04R_16350 [Roseateles sp. BYS78W]|uniref:TrwC relaxase domain-containing protein n=1 Tax=Pelomonas candidula TaxID=3299025 RepID=A0ABW7HER2_9BURK